ncbi:hypothetical protein E1B25_18665 [Antarcticimicrobium sediminis]|uniref:Uncharacterized protein n=1 Tax=Antarcticimicrobium sediminis TaxID=2546227 RepID=A0A4R5EK29_9RHOB|nr:hypothetical protein E1B25_18665 [Antarcticimicrobium sediminis]
MAFEHQGSYETQAGAIAAIAPKTGCIPQCKELDRVQTCRRQGSKRTCSGCLGCGAALSRVGCLAPALERRPHKDSAPRRAGCHR